MERLKNRILQEGMALGDDRISVDGFINHQVDVRLMMDMGKELAGRFRGEKIHKILTIETGGIPLAMATALCLGEIPMVFAKKAKPNTMTGDYYDSEAMSFTKGTKNNIVVSKKYLKEGERILIVDDFLAHGEAASALVRIAQDAGAIIVGVGAAVCKVKQGGIKRLKDSGIKVEALAVIQDIKDGKIIFE